jgi:hypothetical protein
MLPSGELPVVVLSCQVLQEAIDFLIIVPGGEIRQEQFVR